LNTLFTKLIISIAIGSFAQSVFATGGCPENYAGGQPPQLVNRKLAQGFVELCAQGGVFATGYSKLTRDPLYSAEHITSEHMAERKGRGRENSFRPDDRLSHNDRAELSDFKRSGFDRGHMASDADSWSDETEYATYNLSNMIPQAPRNNRGLHAHIEGAVRHFAQKVGEVYTITGPIFDGSSISWLNNRVAIPTRLYKLVYLPSRNEAAAYLEVNSDGPEGQEYTEISVQELNQLTGMNMLPGVQNVGLLRLPKPSGKGVIGE
jgi:endonuclease G, mitochondrial